MVELLRYLEANDFARLHRIRGDRFHATRCPGHVWHPELLPALSPGGAQAADDRHRDEPHWLSVCCPQPSIDQDLLRPRPVRPAPQRARSDKVWSSPTRSEYACLFEGVAQGLWRRAKTNVIDSLRCDSISLRRACGRQSHQHGLSASASKTSQWTGADAPATASPDATLDIVGVGEEEPIIKPVDQHTRARSAPRDGRARRRSGPCAPHNPDTASCGSALRRTASTTESATASSNACSTPTMTTPSHRDRCDRNFHPTDACDSSPRVGLHQARWRRPR